MFDFHLGVAVQKTFDLDANFEVFEVDPTSPDVIRVAAPITEFDYLPYGLECDKTMDIVRLEAFLFREGSSAKVHKIYVGYSRLLNKVYIRR